MKPKPRVGVLFGHLVVDNWEYPLIERIIVSDCAEINVVVFAYRSTYTTDKLASEVVSALALR